MSTAVKHSGIEYMTVISPKARRVQAKNWPQIYHQTPVNFMNDYTLVVLLSSIS